MSRTRTQSKSRGFTLIETLVAIFVFTVAATALLGVANQNTFSALYGKNDIAATYLGQEAIDLVRNDRDTSVFQQTPADSAQTPDWAGFIGKYSDAGCFSSTGCEIESRTGVLYQCPAGGCSKFNIYRDETLDMTYYDIDPTGFKTPEAATTFVRRIVFYADPNGSERVLVVVTVSWLNGNLPKSKVFTETLYNWYR